MRRLIFFLTFLLFSLGSAYSQNLSHVDYDADNSNFPNPGRGFYHADDQLNPGTIANYPAEGITLVFREYHIDDFRNTKIPVWYLWNIKRDLNNLRNAGLKVILRFRYTAKTSKPYGDAPLNIVLMHIKQLEPILRANSDVIFTFQAGFIGAWGEWYYTDYFSVSPGNITEQNWIDRRTLVDSLLSALPPEIMVNVRTPNYKKHLLNEESYNPVTADEAYKNLPVARISHHNDCFLASVSDVGTYTDTTVQKPYLAEDTKYTVIGGETCGQSGYSHCENALKELKRFHWSYLNRDYHQGVIGDWIDEGCYPTIQNKLGYRYKLVDGDFTAESNPSGSFLFKLNLVNEGFANPVNPLNVEVILRSSDGSRQYVATVNGDMRLWSLSDTTHLDLSFGLPNYMVPGAYQLLLNITDPHLSIKDNPSYSIHIANDNIWEPSTGYNKLNHTLTVSNNNTSSYNGGNFFDEKNKTIVYNPNFVVNGDDSEWFMFPVVYHNANQDTRILKIWNTSDSLFYLIKGINMAEETTIFIDADNNSSTGADGYDYKISCCNIYFYNTMGNWEEIQGFIPDYASNDTIKEVALSLSAFNKTVLNENYSIKVHVGNDYLPDANKPAALVYLNKINSVPFVKVLNKGNTNTIFWNRNIEDENGFVKLYRHTVRGKNRSTDTVLSVLPNNVVSYQDKDVDPDKTYIYSAIYLSGNNQSEISLIEHEIIAESDIQEYIDIKLNGNSDDWKLCKPVATSLIEGSRLQTVRFYNTADSLFFGLKMEDDTLLNYLLYFYDDNYSGFKYKISNDSLFYQENSSWIFNKKILSFSDVSFLESGLKLSDIGFDTTDYLICKAYINHKEVWGNNKTFSFFKYPQIEPPDNFELKVSAEIPYHRIKIKWLYSNIPDAYVIQRSVDDSLHFEELAEFNNSTSYYLDNDVDSSHVYYYRMFSHKDILRSAFTNTMWMRPGFTRINSLDRNTGKMDVYPVPVTGRALINVQLSTPDYIEIELLTLVGQSVQTIFKNFVADKKSIDFNIEQLPTGIYLLRAKGDKTLLVKKIVIR